MRFKNPTAFVAVLFLLGTGNLLSAADEGGKSIAELAKQIRRKIDTGKEPETLPLIKEIAAIGGEEAAKAIFEAGLRLTVPAVYKEVTSILAARTDDLSLKFYEAEARGTQEVRQIFLADLLAEMKSPRAGEILGILAENKDTGVRRATVAALGKLRTKECVEPLLKLLAGFEAAKDRGQIYQEARDAIFEVTGQDFDAIADWQKWWDISKATFVPGKKPEGPTQTRKPTRDTAPEFAGKKIFGKNVVFVIDTSGTMRYVMKDDIPGLSMGDGTDGSGIVREADEQITPENSRLAKFWTRIEMAKRALAKALDAFDARARINVLAFNERVKKLEKALIQCNPGNKKKALTWVRKMQYVQDGKTHTQAALEDAFATDRSTTEMYFLSDGIPSKDGVTPDPTGPILDKVESLNRFRKIKIHTFGYDPMSISEGREHPQLMEANNFLKKLSQRTGGTFTLLKVTDEKPPKDFRTQEPFAQR